MSVNFTAIVVRYEPDAMQDTFEDGGFASYDATELRILSPQDRRGKLVVFHSKPADDGSPWKAIGATLGFRLKADWLESKNRQIFTGAVEGLKVIKKPGDGRRAAPAADGARIHPERFAAPMQKPAHRVDARACRRPLLVSTTRIRDSV